MYIRFYIILSTNFLHLHFYYIIILTIQYIPIIIIIFNYFRNKLPRYSHPKLDDNAWVKYLFEIKNQ